MSSKSFLLNFWKIIEQQNTQENKDLLLKAYNFSENAHKEQLRKSWEPYFIHPVYVAIYLWNKFWNLDLTIAWLLHDTIEDNPNIDIETIYIEFGENVWFIVDSLTKTNKYFFNKKDIEFEKSIWKILYWWMKNIWCILVKLVDREHNLSTIEYMANESQVKKSFESQAIYIPLMSILNFEQESSIEKINENFNKYIKSYNIKNYLELKNNLLNYCFKNFSSEMFSLVYKSSTKVFWSIDDREFYQQLLEKGYFDSNWVKIKKIESGNWKFFVSFSFLKSSIFKEVWWKLTLLENKFKS